jgi:hypothetical protein
MPFIWNSESNIPPRELPQPVPPGEITYEVALVANSVNMSEIVAYNTAQVAFNIVDAPTGANSTLPGMWNVLTINTATINIATINIANIITANMNNATILYGYVTGDPTSNLGIADKHYVDAAMANVPTGGSDLEAIINAKGDLLIGSGYHTATRLPVGTAGQVLESDASTPTGLAWKTIGGVIQTHNLWIQTHYTPALKTNQVLLRSADEIVMNDGLRTSGWANLIGDIRISGAGGLDAGSEQPNMWYEIYAIHNASNGQMALMFHQGAQYQIDQLFLPTTDSGSPLRQVTGSIIKLAQSFQAGNTGPLTSVELEISKTGSPTGTIWVTLEADNVGYPSGTPLANSRIMDVARLPTDKARVRFVYDTSASVTQNTKYHIVYQGDYTLSDSNYTRMWGLIAGGYANGAASQYTSSWGAAASADFWFKTFVENTLSTAPTLPPNYTHYGLISYVYNDAASNFKPYIQKDRWMLMGVSNPWRAFTSNTGFIEAVDLGAFVPPVQTCVVKFTAWTANGSPFLAIPIGTVASTDMPIVQSEASGSVSANVRNTSIATVQLGQYPPIIVEGRVILTRMQNVNCRLYITEVEF